MKSQVLAWIIAGVCLVGCPVSSLMAGPTPPDMGKSILEEAIAPPVEDDWEVELRLDGFAPWLKGDIGVGGIVTPVDVSLRDILESLDLTVQGTIGIRYRKWSLITSMLYMKLSAAADAPTPLVERVGLGIKQFYVQTVLFYRILEWGEQKRGFLDVGAGARGVWMKTTLNLSPNDQAIQNLSERVARDAVSRISSAIDSRVGAELARIRGDLGERVSGRPGSEFGDRIDRGGRIRNALKDLARAKVGSRVSGAESAAASRRSSAVKKAEKALASAIESELERALTQSQSLDEWWVDPIVAVRLRQWLTERIFFHLYGDIGGFGVSDHSSRLTWAASSGFGYKLTEHFIMELYFRTVAFDYQNNGFVYDTNLHGLFIGFGYIF